MSCCCHLHVSSCTAILSCVVAEVATRLCWQLYNWPAPVAAGRANLHLSRLPASTAALSLQVRGLATAHSPLSREPSPAGVVQPLRQRRSSRQAWARPGIPCGWRLLGCMSARVCLCGLVNTAQKGGCRQAQYQKQVIAAKVGWPLPRSPQCHALAAPAIACCNACDRTAAAADVLQTC